MINSKLHWHTLNYKTLTSWYHYGQIQKIKWDSSEQKSEWPADSQPMCIAITSPPPAVTQLRFPQYLLQCGQHHLKYIYTWHSDIEGATLLYFWKEYYLMKQTNWFYNPLMGRELKFEKHQTSRRFDGKHIIQKKDIKAEAEEVGGSQPNGWNKYSKNIGKMVFRVQTESLVQLGDEGQSSDKEGKPGDWVLIVFSLLMWGQEFVGATPDSFCFSCELGRHLLSVGGEVNRQRTKSLEKGKRDD